MPSQPVRSLLAVSGPVKLSRDFRDVATFQASLQLNFLLTSDVGGILRAGLRSLNFNFQIANQETGLKTVETGLM